MKKNVPLYSYMVLFRAPKLGAVRVGEKRVGALLLFLTLSSRSLSVVLQQFFFKKERVRLSLALAFRLLRPLSYEYKIKK